MVLDPQASRRRTKASSPFPSVATGPCNAGDPRPAGISLDLLAGLAAIPLFLAWRTLRHDDAFIIYQFARNIATRHEFAFNPGEPIFGVTTPLLTLLLAAVFPFAGPRLPETAVAIGCLSLTFQAIALRRLLWRESRPLALAVVSFLLLDGARSLENAALETNLFAALLLLGLLAWQDGRPALSGVVLGLAAVCRYDAILMPLLLTLLHGRRQTRAAARMLSLCAVTLAPWLLFAQLTFGSILPHTLSAKHNITPAIEYVRYHLYRFADLPLRWLLLSESRGALRILVALTSAMGLRTALKLDAIRAMLLFALGELTAYVWIGPSKFQHWHTYFPALVFSLLFLLGVRSVWGLLVASKAAFLASIRWAGVAVAAWLFAGGLWELIHAEERIASAFWLGWRHRRYEAVAAAVNAHPLRGGWFMAQEIGTLGYLTERCMIDPYGLINATNDFPRTRSLESYVELAQLHRPDLLLADSNSFDTLEECCGYVTVQVFPGGGPWSVLMERKRPPPAHVDGSGDAASP